LPLRSASLKAMTQSGRLNGESGWMASSVNLNSFLMTMSLPVWLRVSSEYPSSKRFALIEDAGRKGCIYGGPVKWAAELPSGPAMVAGAVSLRNQAVLCGSGRAGADDIAERAWRIYAWSWTVGCSFVLCCLAVVGISHAGRLRYSAPLTYVGVLRRVKTANSGFAQVWRTFCCRGLDESLEMCLSVAASA
jgi:hypothetical protein